MSPPSVFVCFFLPYQLSHDLRDTRSKRVKTEKKREPSTYLLEASQQLGCIHGRVGVQHGERMIRQAGGQADETCFPTGSWTDLSASKSLF